MPNQTGTVTSSMGAVVLGSSPNDSITFTPSSGTYTVEYPYGTIAINAATTTQTLTLSGGQLRITCASGSVAYALADAPDGPPLSAVQLNAVQRAAGDQVAFPAANLTATAGAAGALTGAYYYTVTFLTAIGETAPWPGTATVVNPSAQRVNLSAIPIGGAGVIGRGIYRTPAVSGLMDPKDSYLVAYIYDNTTTTYVDNLADGSLGAPVNWASSNRGVITDGSVALVRASDQSTSVGYQAMNSNVGYASTAVGYQALYANTTGRRNVAVGIYSLAALTTGYQNTAIGTHSGNGVVAGFGNTLLGYAAGGVTTAPNNYNVAVGTESLTGSGATTGTQNVAIGYRALYSINTADGCVALGPFSGRWANASRQVFIDGLDRTNTAGCQDIGLIYGKYETTAQAQDLRLNAITRIGPGAAATALVANLQAASTALKGYRGWVSDATVAYTSANVGSTVAGGGSNAVPVFCNGTNWVIG